MVVVVVGGWVGGWGLLGVRFGSRGAGAGQFSAPAAMAVDKRGRLYVADTCNNRVQVEDRYKYIFVKKQNDNNIILYFTRNCERSNVLYLHNCYTEISEVFLSRLP